MNRIYLVDYENVAELGLNGLYDIDFNDCVYIFYTSQNNKISFDFFERLITDNKNYKIKFMKSASGKNALDFQLSSFLGALIEKNGIEEYEYVIVSKDNGFSCLSTLWGKEKPGIKIKYVNSIAQALDKRDDLQGIDVSQSPLPEIEFIEIKDHNASNNVKKATKAKKTEKPKQTAIPKNKKISTQKRGELNVAIQQNMSKAKYDAITAGEVASLVISAYKEGKGKKEIYTQLLQKYKRRKGQEIYNSIKPALI